MSAADELLIRHPVLVVGIGGAGARIASSAGAAIGCKCLLVSSDRKDFGGSDNDGNNNNNSSNSSILIDSGSWVNPSSYKLRSFALAKKDEIKSAMEGFSTVVIISNLAGRAGAAIGPVACRAAREAAKTVISVAVMPFKFEKDRIFASGVALRRIRESSDSTIVMDNDAFLDNNPELTQQECYGITNSAIAEVVASISSSSAPCRVRPNEMNILCTSKAGPDSESSLRDSIAMLYQDVSGADTAVKRAMLYVIGGDRVPVSTLDRMVGYVQGVFREEGATEVAMSSVPSAAMASSSGGLRVHLVASAPQKTRFDRYDPLAEIIPAENVLDWDDLDSSPDLSDGDLPFLPAVAGIE